MLVAVVGHVDEGFHKPGYIDFGGFGELGELADGGEVLTPAGQSFIDRLQPPVNFLRAGHMVHGAAILVLIRGADLQISLPVTIVREGVEFVEDEVLEAAVAKGVAFFHGIIPADHALPSRGGPELDFAQEGAERVVEGDLGNEDVGADLGIVGFAATHVVDGLRGYPGGLKEFRSEGVRGGHVGREAVPLIQPVGLAEFTDNVVAFILLAEDKFSHIADLWCKYLTVLPVGFDEVFGFDGEGLRPGELSEIEGLFGEEAGFDDFRVGAGFGIGQGLEKAEPSFRGDLADVFDDAQGSVDSASHFCCEFIAGGKKIGVINLKLADLVQVGRRDAAPGRAAFFAAQNVNSIVLPGKVEEAVREVGDEAALVDSEAFQSHMAMNFSIGGLPEEFPRIGHHAGTDGQVGYIGIGHAAGKQIKFEAGDGVS